jgi:indole-3-glycerol phosphate synthase
MSRLRDIVARKRRELDALGALPEGGLPVGSSGQGRVDAVTALKRDPGSPLRLIAEIKRKSPSAGPLSCVLAPDERAVRYAEAGAAMVSVLCDGPYFDGSWEHVSSARARLDAAGFAVPILAKEFVLEESQIAEARRRGADAILLIARIVDGERLSQLVRAARAEGVEPLVEVVDEGELRAALSAQARIVGVNARDLDTLAMDPERAARVCSAIPVDVVAVHLSGLREVGDVANISRGRADAALIGEALMRDHDPTPRLRAMLQAARGA